MVPKVIEPLKYGCILDKRYFLNVAALSFVSDFLALKRLHSLTQSIDSSVKTVKFSIIQCCIITPSYWLLNLGPNRSNLGQSWFLNHILPRLRYKWGSGTRMISNNLYRFLCISHNRGRNGEIRNIESS